MVTPSMSATRHPAIPPVLLALVLALLGAFASPASGGVETARVAQSGGEVRDYWTNARLGAAQPIEAPLAPAGSMSTGARDRAASSPAPSYVSAAAPEAAARAALRDGSPDRPSNGIIPGTTRDEILDPAAPEFSAHGKVFFTIPSGAEAGDYVCSGTAVNSRNRSVVWSAGHCVFPEDGTQFVTNWIFVPGYHEGSQPYGQWPAKRLATTGPWQEVTNIKYDLGAAVVRLDAEGQRLQTVVGGRGIGFDQPRDHIYRAHGYPAVPPPLEFTGEREFRCTSPPTGSDEPGTTGPATISIECDMSAGSSGGGWVVDTTLLSVTSYGYPLDLDQLYGPYMSASAKALYRSVRGKPKKKSAGTKNGSKGSKGPRGSKGGKGKR